MSRRGRRLGQFFNPRSNPVRNNAGRYIAGLDAIEEFDLRLMRELGIPPQHLSPAPALQLKTAAA